MYPALETDVMLSQLIQVFNEAFDDDLTFLDENFTEIKKIKTITRNSREIYRRLDL